MLLLVEGLICDDRQPELFGVEIQCAVLVAHRDGDELDLFNHGAATFVQGKSAVEPQRVKIHKSLVRLKG